MGSPPTTPPRVMRGANGSVAGASGYAPAPAAADNVKYLKGDGSWSALSNASAATDAEAAAGTSTTTFVTPANAALAASRAVNTRAPRGALAFDGTAASRAATTLTNQNIGTDAFSVSVIAKVPTSAPSGFPDLVALASSYSSGGLGNAFNLGFRSDGSLGAAITGTTSGDYNLATVTGFITAYAGKVVHIVFTRTGTTIAIYVNGVAQTLANSSAGTPPTWAGSITSTYCVSGCAYNNTSYVLTTPVYSYSLYNLALTQADITEIVELGGAVPERFKFGSQVGLLTGDSSTFTSGVGTWVAQGAGSPSSSAGKLVTTTGGSWNNGANTGVILAVGKRYRITATLSSLVGGTTVLFQGQIAVDTAALVAGTSTTEFTTIPSSSLMSSAFICGPYGVTSFSLDDVTLVRLGAVVHYDADLEGVGYQLHDQSTNKLHALLTTTGVSWSKAATMGYVKVLSDGTTSAQALGGGTILPANCQIIRVRARSISGTPSITLGTASGGSQIVASVALSTTWKDLTIALTGGINTAAASLWLTASAANVVEVQLAYEQLPA